MIQVGRLHAAQGNSDVAVVALRQAVALEPGKAAFWSILGVEVAKAGNWCQAQHCLVRSLQLETSATAWTNLGAVYMALGEHTLANRAFKEAQAAQPDYVRGWAGQVSQEVPAAQVLSALSFRPCLPKLWDTSLNPWTFCATALSWDRSGLILKHK